jgi:hypothetical protein
MPGTEIRSDEVPRRRPLQITLADLFVLILGLALAFWIIRPFVTAPIAAGPSAIDRLARIADRIATLAVRFALAGTLLALVTRLRRGGYPRPAEWLALALVLSWPAGAARDLYDAFYQGLYRLASHPIEVGGITYAPRETTINLLLALVGCLGFAAVRKAIPHRARTPIVFTLAVLLVWGAFPSFLVEGSLAVRAAFETGPDWLLRAATTGVSLLTSLVFATVLALPATATLRDLLRRDRPPWTWSEWLGAATGLGMALAWVLGEIAVFFYRWLMLGGFLGSESWGFATNAAAYGLSWVVVRRYGPDWNRWLDAGPDREDPPRTDPL